MISLTRAVVVEGKYDRATLSGVVDAPILQTDGFGVFKNQQLRALIRRYASTCGLIVLTDSDSAGQLIRSHILSFVGKDADVVNLYIPKIKGKERRKTQGGKEGLLGVEGMEQRVLEDLFLQYQKAEKETKEPLTRSILYELGLFGGTDSSTKRKTLLRKMDLPDTLGVNRLLDAVNFLYGREAFLKLYEETFSP